MDEPHTPLEIQKFLTFHPYETGMSAMKNLPAWTYLDELTPIQNQWMERYILPSCAVIFPQWAQNQPKDFRLDYLLRYTLENQWELAPCGSRRRRHSHSHRS